jgi:hypothetical protein
MPQTGIGNGRGIMEKHLGIIDSTISNMQHKIRDYVEGKLTRKELYIELINRMIKIDLWLEDFVEGEEK